MDPDSDIEGEIIGMEYIDVKQDEEDELQEQKLQSVSHLENLVLSFLSQLAYTTSEQKQRGVSEESQPKHSENRQIVLELANRTKSQKDEEHMRSRFVQYPRRNTKRPGIDPIAQLLRVVDLAHEALINQSPVTKRDLFYRDVQLFKNQGTVDNLVDDLAATFAVSRSALNIRASAKGMFSGSALVIHLRGGGIVTGNDKDASLIPAGEDVDRYEIQYPIKWILVVEKCAVFQTLCAAGLTCHSSLLGPGLLVTGKGYPDLATRHLLRTFSDNLPEETRILVLVDADPYGIDIASVYRYGSINMRHENSSLAAERVEWIGLSTTEVLELGIDREALIPITIHDQRKAISMLRYGSDLPDHWRRELMQMLHIRRKAEIEILSSLVPPDGNNTYQLPPNTNEGRISKEKSSFINPLVSYLIKKINGIIDNCSTLSSHV